MTSSYDITIIGAGHVGSLAALALTQQGYRVALIDAVSPEKRHPLEQDNRVFALTYGTQRLLDAWGVWDLLKAHTTPIHHIHVSRQHRFGAFRMHAMDYDLPTLGAMCAANTLQTTLNTLVEKSQTLTTIAPASLTGYEETGSGICVSLSNGLQIKTAYLIGADGIHSTVRTLANINSDATPFHQHAIVANIALEKTHHHTAYERFTRQGVLAMLPHGVKQAAMILSTDDKTAQSFMALNDSDFLHKLQHLMGKRLTPFVSLTKRFTYPLTQHLSNTCVKGQCVLLGDAYVRLHPVAAQGFNLAVRHIALFVQCLHENTPLSTFEDEAQRDTKRTLRFTNSLTHTLPMMGLALPILDHIPIAKRHLLKGTMKGSRFLAWQ